MSHPPISAIGIDLGTTYSSVGIWRDGRVEIIANESGNYRTPSYVAFTDTERLIGDAAKNQAASNPTNTIFGAKRFMGRRFDDPNVEADRQHRNFVVAERNGKAMFQVEIGKVTKWFAPEEICAMVIGKLKESAEAYLGCQIDAGVIAVPAYFNDSQRQATKNAGSIAGLNVLKVVNEPSAVALAYGLDKDLKGTKKVLIFDLGGGVLDVSVLVVKEGSHFEVLSTAGDTHLGGDDFDDRIVDVIVEKFYSKHKIDLKGNSKAMRRLRVAAERAKKALSVATEVVIELDYLIENVDFRTTISRARFEHNCRDLFDRILQVVKTAVDRALIKIEDIDDVILAGGSSKIPKIQNILTSFLSNKKLNTAINGEEAVTYGAAIQAAIIAGNGNARLQEVLLTDVAPLSLGIETAGGIMTNVITCNTKIPCSQTRIFTTYADNQPAVKIQIFEGERLLTQDNNLLGTFDLTGLRLLPRGTPKIEVTFSLDVNGILTVSAIETSSKMMNNLTITNEKVGGLSQKDISRMRKDAEMYKETDEERKKCADSHNRMERYILGLQRGIKDNSGRIAKQEKIILVEESMKCLNLLEKRGFKNVEEYEEVYKELVANCEPIISKMEKKCVA